MNPLIIQGTANSPSVVLDPAKNIFELSGESRPENAIKFYEPIMQWLDNFANEVGGNAGLLKKMTFDIKFDYYNTISSKCLWGILEKIRNLKQKNIPIEVRWHYDKYDMDMKEAGEEFQKLLSLPMSMIPLMN